MDFGLTKRETKVFDTLLDNVVTTKETLLEKAFGVHPEMVSKIQTRSVDVTVSRLRKKIPFTIETVRGVGYRLLVG